MIYLDHNATTRPSTAVMRDVMEAMAQTWGNASSQHEAGQQAKRLLARSRADIAQALGCKPAELVFTSGATEANHLAVHGLLDAAPPGPRHAVFSAVEHAAHLKLARSLEARGTRVDLIGARADGTLNLEEARRLIVPGVTLVSLMAANNETGVLMPMAEVAALARAAGARTHMDATQFVGKMPFDFAASGWDAASVSAHKFHGPKGIGALLLRQGTAIAPQMLGSQERQRRGGTENLPAIAGFAAALRDLGHVGQEAERLAGLRDWLERALAAALPGSVHVYGAAAARLPGTSYLRFGFLPADVVLERLGRLGAAAASGAACSSGGSEPSHVLTAMGVPREEALCAVRLSLGRESSWDEVEHLAAALPPLLAPSLSAVVPMSNSIADPHSTPEFQS